MQPGRGVDTAELGAEVEVQAGNEAVVPEIGVQHDVSRIQGAGEQLKQARQHFFHHGMVGVVQAGPVLGQGEML